MAQIGFYILVTTARNGQNNHVVLLELHFLQGSHSMCTFNGRYDTLHTSQFITGIDSLIILDGKYMTSASCCQVCMHRSNTRIIQTGTDGKGFLNLSILCLHHKRTGTVNDSLCTTMHGCSRVIGINTMTSSLSQINLNPLIIDIMIDGACSIATATNTSDEVIRIIAANLLFQLPFQLLTDYALHLSHNIRIRMRSHRRTYDIECILRMTAPVADSLRACITQSHIARTDRIHLGTQHLHTLHIGMLALHIGSTHKDFTLHIHQGTDGGSCNTMLTSTGFCDDTGFTHLLCHQDLTDGIVNLVRTGMIQILALQIELTSILFAHSLRIVKR